MGQRALAGLDAERNRADLGTMINPAPKFIACFAAAAIAAPSVVDCVKGDPFACQSSRLLPAHLMLGTATNDGAALLTIHMRDATAGIDRVGPSPLAFHISERGGYNRDLESSEPPPPTRAPRGDVA